MTTDNRDRPRKLARTDAGQFAAHVEQDELPAWIRLRTHSNLSIRKAAEQMGVSHHTGIRYEKRWKGTGGLVAEYIQEPEPGKAYGFWVAYPNRDTITELVHVYDRVSLAWGRGLTEDAALEDALRRGRRMLDDTESPGRFADVLITARGMFAPWDYGCS